MDDVDMSLQSAAADLRARAAAVAPTESALRELRSASGSSGARSPWVLRTVAAATIAAAVLVGFVVFRQQDDSRSVSSASESSTTPTTAVVLAPNTAPAPPTSESMTTIEATTDATLSTSTPFTRCDYTDPGKYPSNRTCPDGTDVEITAPVPPGPPIVVGEPTSTIPEAIVSGEVAIVGQCVYLIDSAAGATRVIVWPAGTSWDSRRGYIMLPDGQQIAEGATIEGAGGYYPADNVPEIDPAAVDAITACLPPGTDQHSGDPVVRAFPQSVTPPTVALTPTS